jgi:choline dehydrogenase
VSPDDTFDVVVVGGGAAGAIVAARLAERGDCSVCLIEAGPSDEGDRRILELGRWLSLADSGLVREFEVEPQARGNSALLHSRAYVLGGCASHNQAIAMLPPPSDLDAWERAGGAGWGAAGTAPDYARLLERIHVEEVPHENACAAAFVESAQVAGLPPISFAERDVVDGVGWLRLNVRQGLRQSSSVAYLHPLLRRSDTLTLRTATTAVRISIDAHGNATGVETTGGPVRARREIVLCAGAIETPKLLLLSGIGPAEHLREVGVTTVHDLPGIGGHFVDRPEGTVIWEADRPVPTGVVQDWEAAAFARSDPSLERADVMIHFGTMPAREEWLPPGVRGAEHAFWMTPNVMRPRSRGVLRLRSADPAAPPRIDPRYYTDEAGADERLMLAGMRLARRIAAVGPLSAWVAREIVPGEEVQTDAELARFARERGTTVQHPAGTCRMGAPEDPGAVVGPDLRVRGIGRLRIADASIFPAMIGVNINLTCMMIGERCAELVGAALDSEVS